MTPVELVQKIHQHRGQVTVEDSDLNLTASRRLPADLLDELRAKAKLRDYLNRKAANTISDAQTPLDPASQGRRRQVLGMLAAHPAQIPVLYLTDPNTAKIQLKAMAESGKILAVDTEACPKLGFKEDREAGLSPATGQLRLVQVTEEKRSWCLIWRPCLLMPSTF
jgi:hypothetical protein